MSAINFGITADQRGNPSVARFRQLQIAILQSLRVCLPGIVQTFYADTQTVDVQITTNEYAWYNTPTSGSDLLNLGTTAQRLPLLSGIPIFIPNGGGLNLTFPIAAGDECLVMFADTPLSVWFQNGGLDNQPIDQRRHNLSDGVAIFGVRSQPRLLSDYSTTSAQLRTDDGETLVDVADGQITVQADTVLIKAGSVTIEPPSGSATIIVNASSSGTIAFTASSITFSDGTHTHDFFLHEHTGVTTGVGVSGGVNPVGP